jgi:hypothetical protein
MINPKIDEAGVWRSPGRPSGQTRWPKDVWYMKYRETTRNMAYPYSLPQIAARMGISKPTAEKYYALWGAPPTNTEGWELRVNVDGIRKLVVLLVQVGDSNYAFSQIALTYPQARLLREQLNELDDRLIEPGR